MSGYTKQLAKDLRAEVERRDRETDAMRRALAALDGRSARNGKSAQPAKRGRVSKSA